MGVCAQMEYVLPFGLMTIFHTTNFLSSFFHLSLTRIEVTYITYTNFVFLISIYVN